MTLPDPPRPTRTRRAHLAPRHAAASLGAAGHLRAALASVAVTGGRMTVKGAAGLLAATGLVAALMASPAIADPTSPAHPEAVDLAATRSAVPSAVVAPAAKAPVQQGYGAMGFVVVAQPKAKPTVATPTTGARASRDGGRPPTLSRVSGVGTSGLTSNARLVLAGVTSEFPRISNVIGVRPDSLPDHPSGHAVDFMIPSPFSSSGLSLGNAVVAFVQAHASQWNVKYVIYRQRIWFPGSGWRSMSDRGSPTANHMDHVHVTVS